MQAGKLRHKLHIQAPTDAVQSNGDVAKQWTTSQTVWGSVRVLSGLELERAAKIQSEASHLVTVRGNVPPITAGQRIQFNERNFYPIHTDDYDQRGIELRIYVKEQSDA